MIGNLAHSILDIFRFYVALIRSPRKVAGFAPSSSYVGAAIVKNIDWDLMDTIVELGAGTGVITKQIDKAKSNQSQAIIFEVDPHLKRLLMRQFPEMIHREDARDLLETMRELNLPHVDVIVSGLPFAMFPQSLREEILDVVYKALKPGGIFITYQYSLQMRKHLHKRFSSIRSSWVPLNFPPMFVHICSKSK